MRLLKNQILCPRCGTPMSYTVESERYNNGLKRISSYYKCPVCGFKLQDQYIQINKKEKSVIITLTTRLSEGRKSIKN